jgi:hypothetical protein
VPNGSRLPHRVGRHTFVVHAHSAYGPVVTKTVLYQVAGRRGQTRGHRPMRQS